MLALCRKVARCFFGLGKAEQSCSSRAVAVSGICALKLPVCHTILLLPD